MGWALLIPQSIKAVPLYVLCTGMQPLTLRQCAVRILSCWLCVVHGVCRIVDLRAKSSSVAVITEAATKDGISASWDHHDILLVAQRNNVFTRLDMRKKRSTKALDIGPGDDVGGCGCLMGWGAGWLAGRQMCVHK